MNWDYALLEIFSDGEGWPKSGTPSDWIAEQKVGWVNGDTEDFVVHIPLLKIIGWKIKYSISTTLENISVWWWSLRHDVDKEWDKMMKESVPLTEEEEKEAQDGWRSALHMKKRDP